jgi:SAM-dependent methyltransferase
MADLYSEFASDGLEPAPTFKTDLFEEAVGPHHPLALLPAGSFGMDGCVEVVLAARDRLANEGVPRLLLVGDLRSIPLRSGSVSRILSGSSLDHFADVRDLERGLCELARILATGGVLALTLDNPQNPLLWIRSRVADGIRRRAWIVPYFVGVTYGHARIRRRLESLGLEILDETALVHAPRFPALWLTRLVEARHPRLAKPLCRALRCAEILGRLPTRYLTGYYVAVRARKPARAGAGV